MQLDGRAPAPARRAKIATGSDTNDQGVTPMHSNSGYSRVDRAKRRLRLEATEGRCSRCSPHSHENQAPGRRGRSKSKDRK